MLRLDAAHRAIRIEAEAQVRARRKHAQCMQGQAFGVHQEPAQRGAIHRMGRTAVAQRALLFVAPARHHGRARCPQQQEPVFMATMIEARQAESWEGEAPANVVAAQQYRAAT